MYLKSLYLLQLYSNFTASLHHLCPCRQDTGSHFTELQLQHLPLSPALSLAAYYVLCHSLLSPLLDHEVWESTTHVHLVYGLFPEFTIVPGVWLGLTEDSVNQWMFKWKKIGVFYLQRPSIFWGQYVLSLPLCFLRARDSCSFGICGRLDGCVGMTMESWDIW